MMMMIMTYEKSPAKNALCSIIK